MYNYFRNNILFPYNPFFHNRLMPLQDMNYPYLDSYNSFDTPYKQNYYNKPNQINMNILNLYTAMHKLWQEHIIWTKLVIMSIAGGLPDVQLISQRLLRNPEDFKKLFLNFYGTTASEEFKELLKVHLLTAADMVNAAKKKDNTSVNLIESKLLKNADDIASFLSQINPYWDREGFRKMLYEHINLLKSEAIAVLTNKYEDSISLFDKIEDQALMMANAFAQGIYKQFPNKF